MNIKRVFLIVLDSFGIGHAPDAEDFGDKGSNTLETIRKSPEFTVPNLEKLGLFAIDGVKPAVKAEAPIGAYGRLTELSKGKDTTIGHWEIAGIVSERPLPVYPDGFPEEILKAFSEKTGRGILLNKPYSGTDAIRDYGEEHVRTGKWIVYTSADSVFQIAAHEDVVPLDELYEACRIARKILVGEHGVGRVIARPFVGEAGNYTRTANRHDFSLEPPETTMMDVLTVHGLEVRGIGKISDIFAGRGIQKTVSIKNNQDGMEKTLEWQKEDFAGLCFVNLVDFDSQYGHRNNVDGYAKAARQFDEQLSTFLARMKKDDVLIITADHGCDPGYPGTDHTREQVPVLVYGDQVRSGVNLGTRKGFRQIAATVLSIFGIESAFGADGFWNEIRKTSSGQPEGSIDAKMLIKAAFQAQKQAYTPYSHFQVGAALLGKSGNVYRGCNVENAAYGPSNCAERTAFFKAVSEGEREFQAIAIVGNRDDVVQGEGELCAPCGVCRQVMMEFCDPDDFQIILATSTENYKIYTLRELFPMGFGKENLS